MKLLPSLFSCVYSGVKLFVCAMKSRRRYSIFVWFIYGLEEKNSKAEVMLSAVHVITSAFEFFSPTQFRQLLLHTTSSLCIISCKRELYAGDEGK